MNKKQTSITLSTEAERLRKALAEKLGISQSAVIELAIRKLAERENVK